MGKPYSLDLRKRVVAAIEDGMSRNRAAKQFGVAISTAGTHPTIHQIQGRTPSRNCANHCLLNQNVIPMPRQVIWIVSIAFRWIVVVILEDYADFSRWNLHVSHDIPVESTIWAVSSND